MWGHPRPDIGAHLANAAAGGECELFYWRERSHEVDFVVRVGRTVIAIEVNSGRAPDAFPGLGVFAEAFKPKRTLLVGRCARRILDQTRAALAAGMSHGQSDRC